MINYDRYINRCDIPVRAMVMCVVLTHGEDYKEVYPDVVSMLNWCHDKLENNPDKELAKEIKARWKKDISSYITTGNVANCFDYHMKGILSSSIPYENKLNVAMSVARWPEFYMYSENDLRKIGQNLERYIGDINAVNYYEKSGKRICPYDPNIQTEDDQWVLTLAKQSRAVKQYLKDHNIPV